MRHPGSQGDGRRSVGDVGAVIDKHVSRSELVAEVRGNPGLDHHRYVVVDDGVGGRGVGLQLLYSRASIGGEKSIPTTQTPLRAKAMACEPVPQATSITVIP